MKTITISDEMKAKLEEIAKKLGKTEESVLEDALSVLAREISDEKLVESELVTKALNEASDKLRKSDIEFAKRSELIEKADIKISEVVSRRWGVELENRT